MKWFWLGGFVAVGLGLVFVTGSCFVAAVLLRLGGVICLRFVWVYLLLFVGVADCLFGIGCCGIVVSWAGFGVWLVVCVKCGLC